MSYSSTHLGYPQPWRKEAISERPDRVPKSNEIRIRDAANERNMKNKTTSLKRKRGQKKKSFLSDDAGSDGRRRRRDDLDVECQANFLSFFFAGSVSVLVSRWPLAAHACRCKLFFLLLLVLGKRARTITSTFSKAKRRKPWGPFLMCHIEE